MNANSPFSSPVRRSTSTWPVPVSITMYNLMASSNNNDTVQRKWFRPEYESRLLVPTRLEVHSTEKDELIYSSPCQTTMIHPIWDLLDERINELEGEDELKDEMYEALRARIVVAQENELTTEEHRTLAEFSLHPKRLRIIPNHVLNVGSSSSSTGPPLKALPPNAVLIQYSDGSTRVPPALYDVLQKQNVVSEHDEAVEVKRHTTTTNQDPRFDDDVFHALDQAVSTPQRASPSALLMNDSNDDKLQIPLDDESTSKDLPQFPELERTTSLLDSEEEAEVVSFSLPTELEASISSLKLEASELERLLQKEEEALEQELAAFNEVEEELKTIKEEIRVAKEEARDILDEAQNETKKCAQAEFQLDTQRIKLLLELQTIYPIQNTKNRHTIRGLELPTDLHNGTVGEDEVSAALGYLVHSVIMVAKYLEIPLRYRLVCNSSRSAVQEETNMFPLFRARMVERAQLDRAVLLLNRNIDCLLLASNMRIPEENSHNLLVKMKRLYDKINGL